MKPININQKFSQFEEQWHPHQIAVVDKMQVLLAKLQGPFVWHSHKDQDELFFVQKGTLIMHFRELSDDKAIVREWSETIKAGELIVVPKGVEHCPATLNDKEVQVLLIEDLSTQHTGEVVHEKTRTQYPKI